MINKLHEQVSALVDDELTTAEQALLVRQLTADAELRERLLRYQVISDSLQNHVPPHIDSGFHTRVSAALQAEPAVQVTPSRVTKLFRPVTGLAVAASVAVVAVFSLQSIRQESPSAPPAVASAPAASDYIRAEVVTSPASRPQSLDIYFVNHNEYAVNRGMLPYVRLVGHEMRSDGKK